MRITWELLGLEMAQHHTIMHKFSQARQNVCGQKANGKRLVPFFNGAVIIKKKLRA
jgi:hypothetical protein